MTDYDKWKLAYPPEYDEERCAECGELIEDCECDEE